jgi:5-methylcytosine-specific restriction endonuclease McrA
MLEATRKPLKKKRAKPRTTKSPRCARLRCNNRIEVPAIGLCKKHAKKEADRLFALAVKQRDGYICQACGKTRENAVIECAHVVGRGELSIRFNLDNAMALCKGCHYAYTKSEANWRAWLERNRPGLRERLYAIGVQAQHDGWQPDYAEIIASLRSQAVGKERTE